jgi:hypothetical protein
MWKDFEATGIGMVCGIVVFLLVNVAIGRDILPRAGRDFQPIVVPEIDLDPESLYATNCHMCHQADGMGLPGQFPPLAGSSWVTEDLETPVRVMLLGIGGEIEVSGATFNGVMPSQGHLNDEQIALLATKVRSSWGNEAPEDVTPEEVAAIRTSLAGRTTSWNGGAELSSVRDAQ